MDDESSITIERFGNYSIPGSNNFLALYMLTCWFCADISELENRYFFLGSENKITLSRFYNIRFLCYYSMNWYPFDMQTCTIVLKMKGKGGDFATLFTDKLSYLGRNEVNQYVVYSTKMLAPSKDNDQLEIKVKMGRNLLTIILTTFVPTVLLNMISYTTTFFKPFFFEV